MSEKKLYKVDVELSYEMAVLAESPEEARQIAEENYEEELRNVAYPGYEFSPRLMTSPKEFEGTLPYGADDDKKTVDQYFEVSDG